MKIPMKNKKILPLTLAGAMAVVLSAVAVAQVAPQQSEQPESPATVVAPVVPTAPTQNPNAVAAIEQSVSAPAPAQAAAPTQYAPTSDASANYEVPPAGPGIFQGSEQVMREFAYINTDIMLNGKKRERLESLAALRLAERELSDVIAGRDKESEKAAATQAGGAPGAGPTAAAPPPPPAPLVNSIYGYGDEMYAEIVLGSTKILATKGTVLADGSRVTDISASGVEIASRRGKKRLMVRGAAGY